MADPIHNTTIYALHIQFSDHPHRGGIVGLFSTSALAEEVGRAAGVRHVIKPMPLDPPLSEVLKEARHG